MIAIKRPAVCLSPDQQHKQRAAVQQMQAILTAVNQSHPYRLLRTQDRRALLQKGYARDLVENLVYMTLRPQPGLSVQHGDRLMIGFTQAAFDPSLYGCDNISEALIKANQGCCSWCERLIAANDGAVFHYRPPCGYLQGLDIQRTAYYALAYDVNNLLFACGDCAQRYKGNHFPVISGPHMPDVSECAERPSLVNPYGEDPRQFIRFNPMNACAYGFDEVVAFYQQTKGLSVEQTADLVSADPGRIPDQQDIRGHRLSDSSVDRAYQQWLCGCANSGQTPRRGQSTIDCLGLNRPALVYARAAQLRDWRLAWLGWSEKSDKVCDNPLAEQAPVQFRSLFIDACNTWQQAQCAQGTAHD
ncbi:hypothetical protein LJ739_01910 [Aestuariibacter halophilus]|uniref:TIGR02646 family protein n=1 Tax=Fluctibacter halophilus TaxID=226011 RepID=A0ABS8G390_9ALTE|nr:hypothetical protein [Aestuariibacter halophilus]MCC2614995.1 hypothetical protein [Aestuariibacter halophilus]